MVDFNHPLAGKEVVYKFKINRKITDDKDKIAGFLKLNLGADDSNVEINGGNAKIMLKRDIPKEAKEELKEKMAGLIPNIRNIEFTGKNK